jgi:glycosyltransferase involved in cell wall biosynthesis
MQPLISIIVPFYNVENYLVRCLDSIVNQTYKNLEIILVNDGSTDSSLDICKRYSKNDSRIKIVNKKHGGVSSSRNAGLDAVTGEYIGFVDSDDYIDENMYMELYNNLIENNCDIATCYFCRVYGDEFYTDYNFEFDKRIFNREEAIKSILLDKELRVYLWTKLYSKKAFDNVRFPINREYEDIDVSISTLEKVDKVVFINKILYFYVNRESSIDNNYNDKNVKDSLEMAYKRYKYVKDNYSDLSLYNIISMITRIVYTFIEMKDKDKIKEYLYMIKEVNDDVNLLDKKDIINEMGTYFIENFNYINNQLELNSYI